MDRNRFSQFEERIQALVEGSFARLFAGRLQPREVALRLARAMEDGADVDDLGDLAAPNRFIVRLHPDDHAALLAAQPDLGTQMARHLIVLARESELRLDSAPDVKLVPDAVIPLHAVIIMAEHVTSERQATQIMTVVEADEIEAEAVPRLPDAYLILEGSRYVALDRSVVNLGRRRDNTIVVDDVRVSRQHCQLRFRFGHFVLYDLGSRGGTFVNHRRVTECVLRNGDVISLAGVTLVYMIEEPPADEAPRGAGDTQVRSQPVDEGE